MSDERDDFHPDRALDEWADGLLLEAERAEVEAHLAGCARCRRLLVDLEETRAALRRVVAEPPPAPPGLRAQIVAALDAEDASVEAAAAVPRTDRRRTRPAARWLLPLAAGFALAAVALWRMTAPAPDPAAQVAAAYRALAEGRLETTVRGDDPAAVERSLRAAGLGFPVRVLDLGMQGFRLVGGGVGTLGHGSARTFYRGDREGLVLCEMFRGSTAALPPADERHESGGFTFHVFRRGGATVVFWQEGEVVCALAGPSGHEAALVALAHEKARQPYSATMNPNGRVVPGSSPSAALSA